MATERHLFSSRIGFVLAGAASAVGLGNLWRFPYLAAEYGGAIFVLIYLSLVLTLGFTLMVTEIAIGRKTGKSAFWAFRDLSEKWHFLGILSLLIPCIILPYYSVIGGWIMRYIALFMSGSGHLVANDVNSSKEFFSSFIANNFDPIIWTIIFMLMTALVLLFGVKNGIQRVCTIIMPALIVMIIGIAIYCICQPKGIDGLCYYLVPDFSKFSGELVIAAMGQMFYSLSLAMGIMITYGSYLHKKENIEKSVRAIGFFDTGVSFLAGLLVVSAVFMISKGEPASLGEGPGLMFVNMPNVFVHMPGGEIVGVAFFICVFFAALTSAISLFEVPVATLIDKFKMSRVKAVGLILLGELIVGVIVNLGYGVWKDFTIFKLKILEFMDAISNNIMMPILALLTCIFIGWIVKGKTKVVTDEIEGVELSGDAKETSNVHHFKEKKFYIVMVKFIAPVCLVAIFIYMVYS
ncbi:MAG TPA: sodium-dependent transporter, partial [Methanocorpusculum sp.]|nr:sodium-dependent transporter [Methanocorpusculum sp.]